MSRLVELLDAAVQQAVFSDQKQIGINVSGGLDSSTVYRLARKWTDLPAFTGFYAEAGFDERHYARMATGNRDHHEIKIGPQDFIDNFDTMMQHFEPPFQGPGMFGQYMVAHYIANNTHVKTVLSGEGADELFGGYARLMKIAGALLPDGYDGYVPPADYPKTIREALDYDYERLPDLLKVDDEALGAFDIEAVAPFTDQRIVDYAMALPLTLRVGKEHLRRAVRGLVPDPIIDRTDKKGFPVPLVQWAQGPLRDFVGDRLGYIPDPDKPFARDWWVELCEKAKDAAELKVAA